MTAGGLAELLSDKRSEVGSRKSEDGQIGQVASSRTTTRRWADRPVGACGGTPQPSRIRGIVTPSRIRGMAEPSRLWSRTGWIGPVDRPVVAFGLRRFIAALLSACPSRRPWIPPPKAALKGRTPYQSPACADPTRRVAPAPSPSSSFRETLRMRDVYG